MSQPPNPDDTLDLTLTRRVAEIVRGAAATEGELRLLMEQGAALERSVSASLHATEERLGSLVDEAEAEVAEIAAELRRAERLRVELREVRASLDALDARAHALRGEWLRRE